MSLWAFAAATIGIFAVGLFFHGLVAAKFAREDEEEFERELDEIRKAAIAKGKTAG